MMMRFLFLFIPFTSISANDKPFEDAVYTCILESYFTQGVDLEKELDILEQQMIKEGLLGGTSGQDKIDYYQRAIESAEFPTLEKREVMDVLYSFPEGIGSLGVCKEDLATQDSLAFQKSTLFLLIHRMEETAKQNGHLDMSTVIETLVETLSAEDLEHPLFRAYTLLTFVTSTERDEVYIRELPEKHVDPESKETCDLTIKITHENNITINGVQLLDEDYLIFLDSFVRSVDNDSLTFCLHFFKTTTYEAYINARSIIDAVHDSLKSESSYQQYGRDFGQLNSEEQKTIENMYIWKIIEKVN